MSPFVPGDFNNFSDQNLVNANCAATSFDQKEVNGKHPKNGAETVTTTYDEGLQPYSTLHICCTYFPYHLGYEKT